MSGLDPAVAWLLRGALGVLFAAAALHKWRDAAGFRATLADYRLLPAAAVAPAAGAIAALEAGLALALWVPVTAPAAAGAAAAVLAAYAAAIGVNLLRGRRHVACGCLGPAAEQPLHAGLVVRNGVLVAAALLAALPVGARPLAALDVATVLLGVATLCFLYLAADGLLASARVLGARP